ncbi:Glycosyltransferase involved in cell wall bisynthesis [Algoriphagus locisalis]|uniref:Glycosyltransferase involved in cell wall bisynthesis n=1 Tax=Algoriphagus locisalis TaxID=305507 RepID=A0A1I6XQX5_9BACT|nr:glycosyltransferase [Algoriphagus locisalis]SFT40483.1 Glycosyltransferase involved in cell wall bisynthesis [Algoriphagus locisalis]
MRILFLGETYRADAKSWIRGIESNFDTKLETMELPKGTSRSVRMLAAIGFFWKIISTRFSQPFDLVLAERATSYGFFSLFVNAKRRIVAQQGISDVYPENGISGFYKSILQRKVYKHVDLIHAWGKVMTFAMLESGASPSKIMVLPKGIDLSNYQNPAKESLEPALIVTRSLFDLYRHVDIVEAVRILQPRNVHIKVYFVGQGPEKSTLESLIKTYKLEGKIILKGQIPNEELPALMNLCRYYVAVPTTEGVSSSLFEAMAAGCYPIVTDLPANQVFIKNGENGSLVEPCNPEQLADAIQYALTNDLKVNAALLQNRVFIEEHVDFDKNMKTISARYKSMLKTTNNS